MTNSSERLLSVEEFSHETSRSTQEIISSLESGRLFGKKVEDEWYIDAGQIGTVSNHCKSEADALVHAYTALNWRSILTSLNARREAVFKAPTVELGLSIANVEREAQRARGRAFIFDVVIGIAGLLGIIAAFNIWSTPSYETLDNLDEEGNSFSTLMLFWAFFGIAAADFVNRRMAKRRAREILGANARESTYDPADCARDEPNVIVSGGYSPFVGAGIGIGGWSFTMNLMQAENSLLPVEEAKADALYKEAESALRVLGMPNLAIRDEIYVDGRDVGQVPKLMPTGPFHCPVGTLPSSQMEQYVGSNNDKVRHYKAIRSVLWDSQVVLSTFLRYVVVEKVMFVEARSFVLPPLAKQFLDLKNLPLIPQFSERVQDLFMSIVRATYIWLPILVNAANFVQGGFLDGKGRWLKQSKKEVLANQRYNYGWSQSLREIWAGKNYERYFQMVDLDFFEKVVRESLLDSLLKSLQQRNICTETLKSATTTIHNEGVIVNGGTLQAENLTAGRSAQANIQRITQRSPGQVKQ